MSTLATTRMSSRGQVVIPEEIRKRLGFGAGTEFVVLAQGEIVILRAITPPPAEEFDAQLTAARKAARRAGLKPAHVSAAIARVRARGRSPQGGK